MIVLVLSILCISLGVVALVLQRLYSSVPAYELKRLSGQGDPIARELYRPVAHGVTLRLLLWSVGVAGSAGGLALLYVALPVLAAFAATLVLLATALVVLPSLRLTEHTLAFARWMAAPVAWLLHHLHPVLHPVAGFVHTHRRLVPHSRLYEKADLVALLHQQKEQQDSRIVPHDLELARRALAFDDRQAADIAIPRTNLHVVNAADMVGPLLLDQLHKSGQTAFLIYKDTPEQIIGLLSLKDAIAAKQGGPVIDLVRPDLAFVHEDFSLREVLRAFQQTGQSLAVVINSFEELVGVISFSQLLDELLGSDNATEELAYDNRAAIAAFRREDRAEGVFDPDNQPIPQPVQVPDSSPEAPEVVE